MVAVFLSTRLFPLALARASYALVHPEEWGLCELLVVGLLSQAGLELYRHSLPAAFARASRLPARGKPLEKMERVDHCFIAFSRLAVIVMTFHFIQFTMCSNLIPWKLEQVRWLTE